MNDLVKLIIASVAFSAIVIAAAQDPNANKMDADQAKAKIEAAGFTNVHDVRREGSHWDAQATDKEGKRVSLAVDLKTGAFTQEPDSKSPGNQNAT